MTYSNNGTNTYISCHEYSCPRRRHRLMTMCMYNLYSSCHGCQKVVSIKLIRACSEVITGTVFLIIKETGNILLICILCDALTIIS